MLETIVECWIAFGIATAIVAVVRTINSANPKFNAVMKVHDSEKVELLVWYIITELFVQQLTWPLEIIGWYIIARKEEELKK